MSNSKKMGIGIALGILFMLGAFYAWDHPPTHEPANKLAKVTPNPSPEGFANLQASPAPTAMPANEKSTQSRYPVPVELNADDRQKLPRLTESDENFVAALNELFGKELVRAIFNASNTIRRIVVTVDTAKQKSIAADYSPIATAPGSYQAITRDGKIWTDLKNETRYANYLKLVQATEMKSLAALYFKFYPLFQSAYHEIKPDQYFNDRAIEMIDHLLSTPEVVGSVELIALNKSYHYADPSLENLSASQKLLVRMGNENATLVREKLKKLRNLLILGL